jgi:hypothetical protein
MSSTAEGRKPARRYAMVRALAPHVDEAWAESFVVELRLLGVEGALIGGALSEVESHCTESEQSAQLAFGPPVGYARSLELPVADDQSPRAVLRSVAPIVAQVMAMLTLSWSFEHWLRNQPLEVTPGHLVIAPVAVLTLAAIVRYADSMLRTLVYHRMRSAMFVLLAYLGAAATGVDLPRGWQRWQGPWGGRSRAVAPTARWRIRSRPPSPMRAPPPATRCPAPPRKCSSLRGSAPFSTR